MKLVIPNITTNPATALRRAGYTFQYTTPNGEMSFVRALARAGYPRFHIYATLRERDLHLSVHIDHKKHTYGDTTRHHGEYDASPALDAEMQRIARAVR